MPLPDMSNSLYVARLRYIQSIHEPPERRNPDSLVRHFLPIVQRWRAALMGQEELGRLRADPFYYYLLARTRYYDHVLNDAVNEGVQRIVGIGCGSDTRPHRFAEVLRSRDVKVLECDQQDAIRAKRRITRRLRGNERVEYLSIDLNDDAWPELSRHLLEYAKNKILVMMEGVSPYVNDGNFRRFLTLIGDELPDGSLVAYDFKLQGVKEHFGRGPRTTLPFRLPPDRQKVAAFHEARGLRLKQFELSDGLVSRLLPDVPATTPSFGEDALVRLQVQRT